MSDCAGGGAAGGGGGMSRWRFKHRADKKRVKRVNEDFYRALMRSRDRGPRNRPHRRWRAMLHLPVDVSFAVYAQMKCPEPGYVGRVQL